MDFFYGFGSITIAMVWVFVSAVVAVLFKLWISPLLINRKLKMNGFRGPPPKFPLGNICEMRRKCKKVSNMGSSSITHDIHSMVFPYFAQWRQSYGKVFIYWLGTEPFLYVAEAEFLKEMARGVVSKAWGKPTVFKRDRSPMFGNGLVMVEGDDWVRHRHIISPAFSPANLKAMIGIMVESTTKMLDEWSGLVSSGLPDVDVGSEIIQNAAEIIAKTSFGMDNQHFHKVFEKLKSMQIMLFSSQRLVGVPFSKFMCLKQTFEAHRLGKEIDHLLLSIITSRRSRRTSEPPKDLLGILLAEKLVDEHSGKKLSAKELVDECKTFFFGGHETTALALTWTLLLLAHHPKWQCLLREEIMEVTQGEPLDFSMLSKFQKMEWVMNEVVRLYSPAPNVQRQAREDIHVRDVIIPKGTNIWIDVVGMHHDPSLWGDDVNEFRPERFKDGLHRACKQRMGFLPFGFGGRMCVGRNLSMMEYKIVLSLILTRFSLSISPNYLHSPASMLSLRPSNGVPLILQLLEPNTSKI